jgi:S-DNA-T family DNA segregation ATPase FtsK/SpoIIIE
VPPRNSDPLASDPLTAGGLVDASASPVGLARPGPLALSVVSRRCVVRPDAAATVADLAVALGWPAGPCRIDGGLVPGDVLLRDVPLWPGSRVAPAAGSAGDAGESTATGGPLLMVLTGPDGGRTFSLDGGAVVVGRAAGADARVDDPGLAPFHAVIEARPNGAEITPLPGGAVRRAGPDGSGHPKAPGADGESGRVVLAGGDRVHLGATVVEVRPPAAQGETAAPAPADPTARRPGAWTVPLARSPRHPVPSPLPPLPWPPSPSPPEPGGAAGLVTAATAAVTGLVLAGLLGHPMLAAFGLVGAAGSAVTWLVHRRQRRRADRRARRTHRDHLAALGLALDERHAAAALSARAVPALAEALAAADRRSEGLWQRRPDGGDAWVVALGLADLPWTAPLAQPDAAPADVRELAARHPVLPGATVPFALRPGTVLGVAGPVEATAAVARSLVLQLVTWHGPADLRVVVGTAVPDAWAWVAWLPHAADPEGGEPRVGAPDALAPSEPPEPDGARAAPATLVVLDDPAPARDRRSPVRALLDGRAGPAIGVILAGRPEQLPDRCTHVLALQGTEARLADLVTGVAVAGITWAGCSGDLADGAARHLARFHDPEDPAPPAADAADAADLLGPWDARAVAREWDSPVARRTLRAVVGTTSDGPLELDFDRDGPHALVAGTTGAGKSELLRTLVASLALRYPPSALAIVLVDYKGGSTFDRCADLPQVVGLVTDLDERLGERVLRSLQAELRRREHLLRTAGAADLVELAKRSPALAPPRLLVVVDEFAALAAELPSFLHALVGVAQRGRSLGLHLVLATQRPGGVVSDDIRANTNLRVALRVQDRAESVDVVGHPGAARLPRHRPGRALVRLGDGELVAAQVAAVTRPAPARTASVELLGAVPVGGTTVLEQVVRAARAAAASSGAQPAARPWEDPLPATIPAGVLPPGVVALVDDPDAQCRHHLAWAPGDGHVLLCGAPGSGVTTALHALAAAATGPGGADLYAVDAGRGLASIAELPGCGGVVAVTERERLVRLVRMLHDRVDRHRCGNTAGRPLVLAIDGLDAVRAVLDEPSTYGVLELLDRLVAEGPPAGISLVAGVGRAAALPASLLAGFAHRWVFRLADPQDGAAAGVPAGLVPSGPAGRLVVAAAGLEAQVALPPAAHAGSAMRTGPPPVAALPLVVSRRSLPRSAAGADRCDLVVGVADADLAAAVLTVHDGDHVIVAGPPRSGRSSALRLLAGELRAADPDAVVVTLAARRGTAAAHAAGGSGTREPVGAVAAVRDALAAGRRAVLCVDDADVLDAASDLDTLLVRRPSGLLVVASGRPEGLRGGVGQWVQAVRRSRLGLVLRPAGELDGDVLGAVLPRHQVPPAAPGRGYLVAEGRVRLVQLALPDPG